MSQDRLEKGMQRMKIIGFFSLFMVLTSSPLRAQESSFQDPLLDQLVGTWVMEGTIAGDKTTHDLTIEWVLAHQYIRITEVAREKDENGDPAYEATVYIGWDAGTEQYACLWLDITGTSGFEPIGHGQRVGDTIPFVFGLGQESRIHNTFAYDGSSDTWSWSIDNEKNGERTPFARVTLRRK